MRRAAERHGVEFAGVCFRPHADAPFDRNILREIGPWTDRESISRNGILREIQRFEPDLLLVSGWMDRDYLAVARAFRKGGGCVVGFCDTPWRGSVRQHAAVLGSRMLQRRWFDIIWVPGARQAAYARRLGFSDNRIWRGMYAADIDAFDRHRVDTGIREPAFLYVGRLVAEKDVGTLAAAYARYREQVSDPWNLRCIGTGPLASRLQGQPGIQVVGFVPPDDLPSRMATASAFVLPSKYEPWGVVLHEAAALGHPLIATSACGSSECFLCDGYNGFLVPPGNVSALALAMVRMHESPVEVRARMGEASIRLSRRLSPDHWARMLVRGFEDWQSS